MTDKREFRIKPLVWEEDKDGCWTAKTSIDDYCIAPEHDYWLVLRVPFVEDDLKYTTLKGAKKWCNDDYEARLSQCLEPVVKVECADCVHEGEAFHIYDEFHDQTETINICDKFNKPCETARLGPCDNGRGGELRAP